MPLSVTLWEREASVGSVSAPVPEGGTTTDTEETKMLSGIPEIQQDGLIEVADFAIESGKNLITFGDAGIGKTEIFLQRAAAAGLNGVYLNLSVIEAPDLVGLMEKTADGKSRYCLPEKFRLIGEQKNPKDWDVLIVDELDKARPELQNPMLELFQFRSINGTKLNIKSVLATGNLPDENAFSQPVSHALTNRCLVFRTSCALDPWMKWAVSAGVNGLIVGFLSRNGSMLLQKAPADDETAYLHCSPRSWTNAGSSLDSADKASVEFQTLLVSGYVGIGAAATFQVWLEHYRHIQPSVDALVQHGTHPSGDAIETMDRVFVYGIACANAIVAATQRVESGKMKADELKKIVNNVMGWMKNVPTEYAIGALKSVLSMELIIKYDLMKISSFMESFIAIRKAWDK